MSDAMHDRGSRDCWAIPEGYQTPKLGHATERQRPRDGLAQVQDGLFAYLFHNTERAADYFRIPPSRVVELGAQVSI